MRPFALLCLLALPLAACDIQARRHELLCGKVTLQTWGELQDAYLKKHGTYAKELYQLQQDPPEECRNEFFYELRPRADGKAYELRAERRPEGRVWTMNEFGDFTEPK